MARDADLYDFFVSYARADDRAGFVSATVDGIVAEQRKFKGADAPPLTCFFDREEIRSLDDWRHRIHQGLAASRLFVAFVSPGYFASEWCRREWHAWIDTEIAKHILASGAAPIYIVDVPGLTGRVGETEVAREIAGLMGIAPEDRRSSVLIEAVSPVVRQIRRRQLSPVQRFFPEGRRALEREDLRRVLEALARDLETRAADVRRAALSFGNVPPYNRRFSGRLDELLALRERLKDDRTGVITGLHGLGGVGKTELAFTYAHAFAGAYPGGRFYVPCEGKERLRDAVLSVGEVAEIRAGISDEERKTPEGYFAAITRVLRKRLDELGHVLLVLDNVDRSGFLAVGETDVLTALGPKLHLLATTRLPPPPGARWLSIGELPEADALDLLEKHRPFTDGLDREAGRRLVRRLGGFALAVELSAAFLAAHPGVALADFVDARLASDLEGLDAAAADADVELRRHNHEKRVQAVLGPTLELLTPPERRALEYAAFLPPDQVAVPWLRDLVGADFPEAMATPKPGFEDAWEAVCRKLWRLALLTRAQTETETTDGSPSSVPPPASLPRVARVHRLVQDVFRRGLSSAAQAAHQTAIDRLVTERDRVLEATTNWQDARWEIEPLDALAELWSEANHARAAWLFGQVGLRWNTLAEWARAELAMFRALAIQEKGLGPDHVAALLNNLAGLFWDTNRLAEAEALMRRALLIDEKSLGADHPDVANDINNLASLLRDTNRLAEAEALMRRALVIDEKSLDPDHPRVALPLNNLAGLFWETNRLAEAEPLLRRALAIHEKSLGPGHPNVATSLNNLAELLRSTNRFSEAEALLRRALVIDEKSFGPNHPDVARCLNNLSHLLQDTNRLSEAEPLRRRALAIFERSLGPDHSNVALALSNLAHLLQATNRRAEAEPLFRRALAIYDKSLGPDHPSVATCLNNLAHLLQATNRRAEAEPLFRRAIAIYENSLGPDHPNVALGIHNLAAQLRDTNRLEEAEPLFRRALVILLHFRQATSHPHPNFTTFAANYADTLQQLGRTPEQARDAIAALARSHGVRLD